MEIDVKTEQSERKSEPSAFWKRLQNSSVPVLFQISQSETYHRRVFWILVLGVSLAGFSYQVCAFFQNYFQYPVLMTTEIRKIRTLPFPAVTICNLNRMKGTNTRDYPVPRLTYDDTAPDDLDISLSERKFHAAKNIGYLDVKEVLKERKRTLDFLNEYIDMSSCERQSKGHQYREFIMTCTFDGVLCSERDFKFFESLQFGNCFTFKSRYGNPLKMVPPNVGLELELNLEVYDYVFVTPNIGARVMIHEPREDPNPEDYGVNIKPGFEASIALEKKEERRLPYPYRDRCRDYHKERSSRKSCIRSCIQTLTLDSCSCVDPTFNADDDVRRCDLNNETQFLCMNEVLNRVKGRHCDCPLPCLSVEYGMILSYAVWPSKNYFKERLQRNVFHLVKARDDFDTNKHRYNHFQYGFGNDDKYGSGDYPVYNSISDNDSSNISFSSIFVKNATSANETKPDFIYTYNDVNEDSDFYPDEDSTFYPDEDSNFYPDEDSNFYPDEDSNFLSKNSSSTVTVNEKKKYLIFLPIKDVRKNFAKLKVFYRSTDVTTHRQTPMFQKSEFFGQLGGLMGLWLGISIFALFELMESIFFLIIFYLNKIK